MRIVSLLTDFGLSDPYVAEMKATILSIDPTASIVDITHNIEQHNIIHGAYVLEMAVSHFPKRSVHVAVVDPGVGSARLPILIICKDGSGLVGPDNGLLVPAARVLGMKEFRRIDTDRLSQGSGISSTFHGRDVFAIVAAKVARGVSPARFGQAISRLEQLSLPSVTTNRDRIEGSIIHIDGFGNVITNVRPHDMSRAGLKYSSWIKAEWKTRAERARYVDSYFMGLDDELLVLPGSQGYMEIAVREGSASERMKVKLLDRIRLSQG